MTNNDQLYEQIKDLLEANLKPIRSDVSEINRSLKGNGHKGLIDEVDDLKGFKLKVYTIYGVILFILAIVGIYLRQFIEDLYKHIYLH